MLRVAAEPACRANEVPSEAKTTNSAKANFTDFDMGESSKIKFTRNPNAGEAHLGSQSFHTNKLKFIEHSRNAPATKLPFLARLLTHSGATNGTMRPAFLVFVLALIAIAFEVYSDAAFTSAEVSHAAVLDTATWAIVHGLKRG
jgi:hypothetical protein